MKKTIVVGIKLLIILISFWILFSFNYVDIKTVTDLLSKPLWLIKLVLVSFFAFCICSIRWMILLRIQNISVPLKSLFQSVYLANFYGQFLPGVIGSDAVRITHGLKYLLPNQKGLFVFSIITDRIIGAIGLIIIAINTYLFFAINEYFSVEFATLIVGLFLSSIFLIYIAIWIGNIIANRYFKKIIKEGKIWLYINRVFEIIQLYGRAPTPIVVCCMISIVTHLCHLYMIVLLSSAMGIDYVTAITFFSAGLVALLVNSLSITPGGFGVGELAFVETIKAIASGVENAAFGSIMISFRVITAISLIPAPIFLFFNNNNNNNNNNNVKL